MVSITTSQTIFANIVPASGNAIDYGADDITVTIAENVLIASRTSYGVYSGNSNSTLINGNIVAGDFTSSLFGVVLITSGAVTNNKTGSIIGDTGVYVDNGGVNIANHGKILGLDSTGVLLASSFGPGVLTNDGEIFGYLQGVAAASATTDPDVIRNSGLIHSAGDGVSISNFGLTTTVTNLAGGTIRGANAAIHTTAGALSLTNRGILDGGINCDDASAADTVINRGKIIGEVDLAGGGDVFNSSRGSCGAIFGEAGNDRLIGSHGKNTIVGGLDKDTLTGGAGRDKFVFNDLAESAVGANRDLITDFHHEQHDRINLHSIDASNITGGDQAFHFIGSGHFHHKAGELRYANHILQSDVDGDSAADFQIHVNAAHLVKADFIL